MHRRIPFCTATAVWARPPAPAALVILALMAAQALGPRALLAQSSLPGNSVGVFFDPQGTSHDFQAVVGVPFSLYVVANRPLDNLYAFELAVQVDPRLRVLARAADPQSDDILAGEDQWAVSFRSRCIQLVDPFVLLTYQVIADAPGADLTICLTGSTPSSLDPPAPAHIGCPILGFPTAFAEAYAGCARVQVAPAAGAASSWGTLKERFSSGH